MLDFLLLLIISTEATTEIICKSLIFEPLKKWIHEKRDKKTFNFLNRLLDCPYCTSVWVAGLLLFLYGVVPHFKYALILLVLHRLSNLFHFIMDRFDPNRIDLEKVLNKEEKE